MPDPHPSRAVWLPFALCLLLTAAASGLVARAEHQAHQARVAGAIITARDQISERMASYLAVLRASSGLLSTAHTVSAGDFHAFVERLGLTDFYPGTLGIGYTERLGPVDAAEATARVRAEGYGVQVWPETPRDEAHAIVLLEPLNARNRAALGFDMSTEPVRREAMDRARDTGRITLSGKVTLVQEIDADKQPGFLLYAPMFVGGAVPDSIDERRAKLKGYVYAPLRAGDLFGGVFGAQRPPIHFDLYDGSSVAEPAWLYSFGEPIGPHDAVSVETISVGGHVWTARFASNTPPWAVYRLTAVVSALGLLLSAIVLHTTRAHERTREREIDAVASAMASEEMLKMKDTFIGILGHDLRTPLNAISMTAQLLQRKQGLDQSTLEALGRIRTSTSRMARMIGQLLDATRAQLGGGISITARPTSLGPVVRDVVDEIARAHPTCTLEVDSVGALEGSFDPDWLAQVFSNLVGNAVRYHDGAPVRVKLDGTAPDRLVATVHNAGLISPSLLPVVFETFRTPGVPRGKDGGLGLGLFITRAIVEAHGGTVTAASAAGLGTTFTVVLPRYRESTKNAKPGAARKIPHPHQGVGLAVARGTSGDEPSGTLA